MSPQISIDRAEMQVDLAAERVGHALIDEFRGVRSLRENRRLANRAIAGDQFDVPALVLRSVPVASRYVR